MDKDNSPIQRVHSLNVGSSIKSGDLHQPLLTALCITTLGLVLTVTGLVGLVFRVVICSRFYLTTGGKWLARNLVYRLVSVRKSQPETL